MSRVENNKKKKAKLNPGRFALFVLIVVVLLAAIIFGVTSCGRKKGPADPDPGQSQGNNQSQTGENQGNDKPENDPPKDPKADWPNTTTKESSYPLSKPDDDILVLVNKTHAVDKNYVADDLIRVEHCDPNVGNNDTKKMRKIAAEAFEELHEGALKDGYNILMRTGYRSYDYQTNLYNSYVKAHGQAEADTYSARPGLSEHQTGLACDVGVSGVGLTAFNNRPEAKWIAENCYKYGFILRYPADKTATTGYIYESWHIRYVGKEAAAIIFENGWVLEEYLEAIKDYV